MEVYGIIRFSEVHEFENPNDMKGLQLMNACAIKVMEEFPDLVFGYGFSQEYRFGRSFYSFRLHFLYNRAFALNTFLFSAVSY